jgi:Putative zinc-finger
MTRTATLRTACKDYEQDLVLYYYAECSDQERVRIDAHIRDCPSCAGFLDELRILLPLTVKTDEPPRPFWESYSHELREKLTLAREIRPWWHGMVSFLRPFPVPALAAALVLLLAVTLTLTKGMWRTRDVPPKEEALLEALPMAENLEFYKAMEFLDSLDFLEDMGSFVESGTA